MKMKKNILLILSFFFAVNVCAQNKLAKNEEPFVLGTIETLKSTILNENRILNIYLPEGYNPKDSIKYPVIYLLDGSADEDFIHVVGLVQFNSFEWVNRIPKSIVVGIATVDRKRDFTFPTLIESDQLTYITSGYSSNFMSFIEKELQPYIEGKYKTSEVKTLIGQSLGGLFATEVLLKKPSLFSHYIIISPSLWWNNGSLLSQPTIELEAQKTLFTHVFIGVGKEGLTPSLIPRVMEVDANLLYEKINAVENDLLTAHFDYLPEEDHATIMHQALSNAILLLFAPKSE